MTTVEHTPPRKHPRHLGVFHGSRLPAYLDGVLHEVRVDRLLPDGDLVVSFMVPDLTSPLLGSIAIAEFDPDVNCWYLASAAN